MPVYVPDLYRLHFVLVFSHTSFIIILFSMSYIIPTHSIEAFLPPALCLRQCLEARLSGALQGFIFLKTARQIRICMLRDLPDDYDEAGVAGITASHPQWGLCVVGSGSISKLPPAFPYFIDVPLIFPCLY